MSIRWLLVLVISGWLLYEYLMQTHIQSWCFDSRYAKIIIGVIIILILCFAPSLDSIMQQNNDIKENTWNCRKIERPGSCAYR